MHLDRENLYKHDIRSLSFILVVPFLFPSQTIAMNERHEMFYIYSIRQFIRIYISLYDLHFSFIFSQFFFPTAFHTVFFSPVYLKWHEILYKKKIQIFLIANAVHRLI